MKRNFLYALFRHWGLLDGRLGRLRRGGKWEQARSALILGRIGCLQAIPDIQQLLERTANVSFIQALEYLGDSSAIHSLLDVLVSKEGKHRTQPVISALVRCARDCPEQLDRYLGADSEQLRRAAAAVLAEVASAKEVEALVAAANDPDAEVRAKVARALGRDAELQAIPALEHLAEDRVWYVRLQAVVGLGNMRQVGVHDGLLRALKDEDWRVREKAALGLYHSVDDIGELFDCTELIQNGHDVLVSTLDPHGLSWDSLAALTSPNSTIQGKSRSLIVNLLKTGKVSTVFSGIEFHPKLAVREELVRLVNEYAEPNIRLRCRRLLSTSVHPEDPQVAHEQRFAAAK